MFIIKTDITQVGAKTAVRQNRALALDALRGLAILAMLLSGQLPFDQNALPSWMYHAQEPPPTFEWNGALSGISWVDLVFPFFLFSMGAAFPLALSRRMEEGTSAFRMTLSVLERGFLLAFFALFVQDIRPYTMSSNPGAGIWLKALLGFGILFLILTRLPAAWPGFVKFGARVCGWGAALLFCLLTTFKDGKGFSLDRSDIIIVVLANMAVFGSVAWMLTRNNLVLRLGLLGIVFAVRMSNMPGPTDGWVHDLWEWSPAKWIYRLYYLQYLCIVIPGTIAGELILKWTKTQGVVKQKQGRSAFHHICSFVLMAAFVLVLLCGLKARWLLSTTLTAFFLCAVGLWMFSKPRSETESLYRQLFQWAVYWIVLGLVFEPYEGGIRKDHPTLSYYFVTSGLAICVFIALSILIDVFEQRRALRLLVENGQNPMIAYAGINNFTTPVLALTGGAMVLDHFATTPWLGFWKGVIITMITAVMVSFFTRKGVFWRT